tara:strand:+ start:68 stop:1288 length:1221 start_codon:yes stop_codon:yes gene_type:complete
MSGGGTAVINASCAGVIHAAQQDVTIDQVYVGINGILGLINNQLYRATELSKPDIRALKQTPSCAFGTCRYKLKPYDEDPSDYQRIAETFTQYGIACFIYIGGNDSQDTAYKVQQACATMNLNIQCIGVPKTIDNDLVGTHVCPGYGSAAKYIAISTLEASIDVKSMYRSSTKVFILEVMGRHAGWLAVASALARQPNQPAPHIILVPEKTVDTQRLLNQVQQCVNTDGYCVIVASEGIKNPDGTFWSSTKETDAFGHKQLGGVAPKLAKLVSQELQLKCHWAVSDYLQRSARHIASAFDVELAYRLGLEAVTAFLRGDNAVMLSVEPIQSNNGFNYRITTQSLATVANQEKIVPDAYLSSCGMDINPSLMDYLKPLIQGEAYPDYQNGLPNYFYYHETSYETELS